MSGARAIEVDDPQEALDNKEEGLLACLADRKKNQSRQG